MAEYLANRDGGKTNEEGFSRFVSNLVSGNTISTGWAVSQKAAGANMSVDIAAGTGKIDSGTGYAYEAWSDAIKNVAITTADATNPRRDIVVAYIDKAVVQSSTSNNVNALKFLVVAGTPAGSPADPSGATIQAAVGASNPYIQLARATVGAGVTTITNSVITDLRTTVSVNANIGGSDGWLSLGYTPGTVTCNGNRSYDLTFTGVDLTSILSNGMRLRTTRTTAAPTQCTSLNGTSQYYNKTSPAGMTFTDDFTVSAWVKLTSFTTQGVIASRYNGTSGWVLYCGGTGTANGAIQLAGFNGGSGNFSYVISYQSLLLNKWVHVTAQLDMSAFTATTTTSYIMLDGVDVPATVARGGTNPTALVQAGNLEIGSNNGGLLPLPGKLSQVAIFSAKVTQATMRGYISQGLSGSETNLVSAYSFNNTINDLNTGNANNLTAQGSAVATNADSPFGGQASGSISSTLDYAVITKIAYSTNTTVTVQVPEGCTITTSGGVGTVSYSSMKVPYGMPTQKSKWRISAFYFKTAITSGSIASSATTAPITGGAITIPIGAFEAGFNGLGVVTHTGSTYLFAQYALSTSTSSITDNELCMASPINNTSAAEADGLVAKSTNLDLTAATTYYMVAKPFNNNTTVSLNSNGITSVTTILYADLAL